VSADYCDHGPLVAGCPACDAEAARRLGDGAAAYLAARDTSVANRARRATLDPGAFVKRGPDYEGNEYGERLDQWQARAMAAAIGESA